MGHGFLEDVADITVFSGEEIPRGSFEPFATSVLSFDCEWNIQVSSGRPRPKGGGNGKVAVISIATVVHGNEKLKGIVLTDTVTGESSKLAVNGLFVAIGHTPATGFLRESGLEFNDAGYIDLKGRSSATTRPGVFAAGDVADDRYRQAVTAAGMGCQAALDAEHYLGAQGVN